MRYGSIIRTSFIVGLLATSTAPSWAGKFAQEHPRRAEVLHRDNQLQKQANNDKGHLDGHYGQITREDQSIRNQEQRDARQNGGYITKGEQNHLNHEENGVQRQIDRDSSVSSFGQEHPRRAEVLGRDNRLNNEINNDKGHLDGQYGQLKGEDQSIRRQEQNDARQNGGYITKGEQQQLNGEENHLQRQVNQDNSGFHTGGIVGRDAGLNNQINNDKGHLDGHYGQLSHEDQSIQNQYMQDRMRDGGGNLTQGQRAQLNGEENHLQRQVDRDSSVSQFGQQHPRRAEVLGRDNGLNNQINNDEGHLSGQYGALKQDDQAIRRQEQADARANGGYITTGQQQQLNREENQLQRQVYRDNQ